MKELKHKIIFASKISPIVSEERDRYLSIAAKNNLSKYFPKDINFEENVGFQGFVGQAFVANKLNLNSDAVQTEEAIKIADMFPFSYCDINHSRKNVVGVIVSASFCEFGSNKSLSREDVSKMTSPFCVIIGGIIWRAPNPDFADMIESSNDPSSEFFEKLYLSWELSFSDYNIIVIDAKKTNIEDGKIITDKDKIKELTSKLQAYGGNGFTDDGLKIGRIPVDEVVPLGVGIVENPAGQVLNLTPVTDNKSKASINEDLLNAIKEIVKEQLNNNISKNIDNNENKISQSSELVVNANINKVSSMKIEKFEQLTDENLKEVKVSELKEIFAASTKDILDENIKKISKDYVAKLEEKDVAIKANQDSITTLNSSITELNTKLSKASEDLAKVLAENKQREEVEAFSARMESIYNAFDLDDKQKEIVANKVKTLGTDADFNAYMAEIEILLAAKKKKKDDKKDDKEDKKDMGKDDETEADDDGDASKKSKASISTASTTVIDDAIKNGEKDKQIIPNTIVAPESLAERAKKAFGLDGWTVVNKRKNRS